MSTKSTSAAVSSIQILRLIEHVRSHLNEFDIVPPPDFSEELYLKMHPDVAEVVAKGQLKSGYHHWVLYGRKEGRMRGKV